MPAALTQVNEPQPLQVKNAPEASASGSNSKLQITKTSPVPPSIPYALDPPVQSDEVSDISIFLKCNSLTAGEESLCFSVTSDMEMHLANWVRRRGDVS